MRHLTPCDRSRLTHPHFPLVTEMGRETSQSCEPPHLGLMFLGCWLFSLRKVATSTLPTGNLGGPPARPQSASRPQSSVLTPESQPSCLPTSSFPPCVLPPSSLLTPALFSSPLGPPCGLSGGQKGDDSALRQNQPFPPPEPPLTTGSGSEDRPDTVPSAEAKLRTYVAKHRGSGWRAQRQGHYHLDPSRSHPMGCPPFLGLGWVQLNFLDGK